MKLYLIDDDRNIINILKLIIRDRNLGELCGTASCGVDALDDFTQIHPDIVIVDLLMPEIDGIALVKQARILLPDTAFIMLSQVSSKDMISQAYENGVEFYIQKPINSIEVESVIKSVTASITAHRTLKQVQSIFSNQIGTPSIAGSSSLSDAEAAEKPHIAKLKTILQRLGIIGEKGSRDIITLVDYLIEHNEQMEDLTLNQLCSQFSDNPKSMEQRIRRTANMGMVNLANLGIEDYYNDIFTEYSNTLYNFEQIRRELDHIWGKSVRHGNVKIKNFLNALVLSCEDC